MTHKKKTTETGECSEGAEGTEGQSRAQRSRRTYLHGRIDGCPAVAAWQRRWAAEVQKRICSEKEACRWTRQRYYRPIDQDSCGVGLGQESDLGTKLREIVFQVNKRVESRGRRRMEAIVMEGCDEFEMVSPGRQCVELPETLAQNPTF